MAASAYDFHGVRLEVAAQDASVRAAIAARLKPFATAAGLPPDLVFTLTTASPPALPATDRPVYESEAGIARYSDAADVLVIETVQGAAVLVDPGEGAVRGWAAGPDPDPWLHSRPLFTLPLIELLKRRGLFSLHASAVALGDRAVVFPGASGAGKSTLALVLARAGFGFLADDMVFLDATGTRVHGFADEVDLTEDGLRFFPELRERLGPDRGAWPKHRVRAEEALGARLVREAAPAAIVLPAIGGRVELTPITPGAALLELAPNVLLTQAAASQSHLDALAAATRSVPCFRLQMTPDVARVEAVVRTLLDRD